MDRPLRGMVVVVLMSVGCRAARDSGSTQTSPPASAQSRPTKAPSPSAQLKPTILDYVDADGFDGLFEASLINQDPVIVVRTANEKPEWQGRLNAWIAAWNMGGKAERRVARGQIPLPAAVNADFLHEFRLLVFGSVDRAEDLAKAGSAWWHEERVRSRRVTLLRRYNLRFHVGEDKLICLIFFNGDYASKHREFMTQLTGIEEKGWSRTVDCSFCSKMQAASQPRLLPPVTD